MKILNGWFYKIVVKKAYNYGSSKFEFIVSDYVNKLRKNYFSPGCFRS